MLSKPTKAARVLPTILDVLAHPAAGIRVLLDIRGSVGLLKASAVALGSASADREAFDPAGEFLGIGKNRWATKGGRFLRRSRR